MLKLIKDMAEFREPSEKQKKQYSHLLSDDEEMVFFGTVSKHHLLQNASFHFIFSFFIAIAVFYLINIIFGFSLNYFIFGFITALLYGLFKYHMTKEGNRYILTNRRVVIKKGYFKVDLLSTNYSKITHIEVDQGVLDRLLYHHGKVIVNTSGVDAQALTIKNIENPIEFKNILERLITRERQKYGRSSV